MSYILDALKKADAEREREGVPSIHAQHAAAPMASEPAGGAAQGARWAIGGAVAGLVLLAGVWALLPASQPQPPEGAASVAVDGAVAQGVSRPMAPEAYSQASTQPATPVNAAAAPQTQAPQVQPPGPSPSASPLPPARSELTARAANARSTATVASPARNTLRVDPSLQTPASRVVPVAELPDEVRRELPSLSIGGAMHSDVPANRMLVLNGSVFHEGDQPAPGLVLEEIKLKSATFRFKAHRYSVAY